MRQHWTLEKSRAFAVEMERQLEHVISVSRTRLPPNITVPREHGPAVHEAVVNLITLYRDHVPGANSAATLITRTYANCAASKSEILTSACVQTVLSLARTAREQHLSPTDG
jgi:hypothetical protein